MECGCVAYGCGVGAEASQGLAGWLAGWLAGPRLGRGQMYVAQPMFPVEVVEKREEEEGEALNTVLSLLLTCR